MKRSLLAIFLSLCLLAGLLPTVALADGDDATALGSLDLADGSITITSNGYTQGDSTTETAYTGTYTITQTEGNSTANTVTVESGAADMTIGGLNVVAEDAPAIYVKAGATLNLTVKNENTLTGGDGFAAICVEPAYDSSWNYDAGNSAKLYISGDGTLTVTGGDGGPGDAFGGGAGIGGNGQDEDGNGVDFGSIVISSDFTGSIHAAGGDASESKFGGGAGIGGGGFNMDDYLWGNVAGQIEIHNGNIIASSNGNGAGIGGGGGQGDWDTATSDISIAITGGNIEAAGGTLGAGIGGGGICDGGTISINSAAVTVMAGNSDGSMGAAGIGGGNDASVSSVRRNLCGWAWMPAVAPSFRSIACTALVPSRSYGARRLTNSAGLSSRRPARYFRR